jgi:hypothetical protein
LIVWFIIIFFINTLGSFAYGFPVSIAAEILTKKISPNPLRAAASGLIHLTGGILFYLIMEDQAITEMAIISSIIFFLTDEGLRLIDKQVFQPCFKNWA